MEARAGGVYRTPRNEPKRGEVRHKVWRYLFEPEGEYDPVWAERCKAYWELQAETYGWKMSNFTMTVDREEQCVVTWCIVEDILPGERRDGYTLPRVLEERAKRQALTS